MPRRKRVAKAGTAAWLERFAQEEARRDAEPPALDRDALEPELEAALIDDPYNAPEARGVGADEIHDELRRLGR
jgi:hypothetical protein